MRKVCGLFVLAAGILLLGFAGGCETGGGRIKGQSTDIGVSLTKKNYRLIKAGACGESTGFRLFGVIPFASPSYADAKRRLYDSVDIQLEGKAIALVNQTEDHSLLYLILFSIPKLTLTADIIEYLE